MPVGRRDLLPAGPTAAKLVTITTSLELSQFGHSGTKLRNLRGGLALPRNKHTALRVLILIRREFCRSLRRVLYSNAQHRTERCPLFSFMHDAALVRPLLVRRRFVASCLSVVVPRRGRGNHPNPGQPPRNLSGLPNCGWAPKFSPAIDTLWLIDSQKKISKFDAHRCQSFELKCTKFDFCWGFAPNPAGGAYSAPPDSLAALKGAYF